MFRLLHALDTGALDLDIKTQDGNFRSLEDAGLAELAGSLLGAEQGWRTMYSAERAIDDLANLDTSFLDDL